MSSNHGELALQGHPREIAPEGKVFSQDQVDLLKNTFCKGATNDEFSLFLEVCKSKNLDPFSKQIHAVKRWEAGRDGAQGREVMSFQTGIDGFRVIADRTGRYAGQDEPLWCGDDGVWKDVWLSKAPPAAAKCSIYRHGWAKPLTRVAKYSEYVQLKRDGKPNSMWEKMASGQIYKCAEALAFRAAFPECSGLYGHEEMQHLDTPEETKTRAEKIADAQAVAAAKIAELKAEPLTIEAAPIVEEPPATAESTKAAADKFKALAAFKDLKKEIIALTGSDDLYYRTLGSEGYEKSNQIPGDKLRTVYRVVGKALVQWKADQPLEVSTEDGAALTADRFPDYQEAM